MSEISQALYRKYRPSCFEDVKNQDDVVAVLMGAIKKKLIPHALLFTGSRGTGKTTVARIFARAIGAKDVDVYEIDAASNRGIDDIRELKEAVYTLPYESPYKVYIIDEVHMLTKEAFNALLKTLEEPPSHVIFILATTERDKLLDTIISRCQVLEFHAPMRKELREFVLSVAEKEKYTLDTQAADVIALAADGSFRDALGIVQKVMLLSGDTMLTDDEVAHIVGAPKNVILQDLVSAFANKDIAIGLQALTQAHQSFIDIKLFHRLLIERLRTILLVRHDPSRSDALLDQYTPDEKKKLLLYAKDFSSTINSHLLLKVIEMGEYIGKGSIPELPLELALILHCNPQ